MSGSTGLDNALDLSYLTNITLGGTQYSVQVDTGSSDLWVADKVPNSKSTGKTSGVTYAIGAVKGPVKTADLDFAGYTIKDQAYLEVSSDADHAAKSGLIGLGPSSGSNIHSALGNSNKSGDPPLDRIFQQNTATPNYITFLLGRSDDPDDPFPGQFTVGEVLPGYENVTSQPKLEVTNVMSGHAANQHWQVLMDEDGFIGPDGTALDIKTRVTKAKDSRLNVVLDTGFSLPQVPRAIADAIYKNISGSKVSNYSGIGEVYTIPCTAEVNITFKFGGVSIPVHPLDVSMPSKDVVNGGDNTTCIGTFQPMESHTSNIVYYDMILGMSWLRNAYVLINAGDFIDGASTKADPYAQMLPLTNDTANAHQDFVNVRLGGIDTTDEKNRLGDSNNSTSHAKPTSSKKPMSSTVKSAIGAGVGGLVGLVAIAGGLAFAYRHVRSRRASAYAPLGAPAPAPARDMHLVPSEPVSRPQHDSYYDSPLLRNQHLQQGTASIMSSSSFVNPWDRQHGHV